MCSGLIQTGSRGSSVGIATRYGLEGLGIESRWGEIFRTYPDLLRGPPSLLYNGYRVFPGGKGSRVVMLTTHPLRVPRLRKSWAIPPLNLWVLLGLLRGPPPLYWYRHVPLPSANSVKTPFLISKTSSVHTTSTTIYRIIMVRDSSVGIATLYGLDGPGIESQWGARFTAPVQTGPGANPASYKMGTGSFPEIERPGFCSPTSI
jgi:hypothetical protein